MGYGFGLTTRFRSILILLLDATIRSIRGLHLIALGEGKVDKEVARHPTTSQLVAAMTVISYITQVILSLMTEACLLSLLTNLN